jgi:hypothetical protein
MCPALAYSDPIEFGAPATGHASAEAPGLSLPPVIGRLAGLPARALEPLASPAAFALLRAREPIEAELGAAREELAKAIGDALPQFGAAARRLLLAVRRSCFNGRGIGGHRARAEWADLLRVSARLPGRIVALEERLRESDQALGAVYQRELARERRHVLDQIEDRRFLRGVAVGRPGLVEKARREAPRLAAAGFAKDPAKWEESLLRFVTRAAAKLSANSTLTSYALGSVQPSPIARGVCFDGGPRRETSLVRLDRPQLEQFQALLMCHPAVRRQALVAWNDSVEEIEPGRFRYVRDGFWQVDGDAGGLRFVEPARIKVSLANPLLGAARDALREGPLGYDALLALLGEKLGPAAAADAGDDLEQLLDLRLLLLLPPWPTHEAWLERRIARFLRALPGDPALDAASAALDGLLALEEGFASAPRPERSVVAMEESFSRLMQAVVLVAGRREPLATAANFFEDVLFEPAGDAGDDRGVFQVASSAVGEILEVVRLVSRFDALFNFRHDVLHTLAGWWRERGPAGHEAPFSEIAQGFAPLWKEFRGFFDAAGKSPFETFDPLASPALAALREERRQLIARTREAIAGAPAKDVLPVAALAGLVEALPRRYAPLLGSSVFVQPTDAEGSSWVLNNVTEGTGRYLSRIVPAMAGPRRERFLGHLTARSAVALDGEEADLLEVKHPWNHLVRAHPPQAARVLDLRGLHLDLPRERRLGLGDLTVQADLESGTFRLIDRAGRRVLPASLSTLPDAGLPNLLRFLLMFGPGETRGIFPFSLAEGGGDLTTYRRLTCGKVVVRRRSWAVGVAGLRDRLAGLSDLRAYIEVDRWCRRLGLPAEVYYGEVANCGKAKPQYLRFDSPSLCRLFVASLGKLEAASIHFIEALPSPHDFPLDASTDRRGFELLIDTLAIRDPGESFSARTSNLGRERSPLGKEQHG